VLIFRVTTTVVSDVSAVTPPLTTSSSQKALDLVLILPFGPLRMVPHDLGQVETSINLGTIETNAALTDLV
jgi:hypothetical protein